MIVSTLANNADAFEVVDKCKDGRLKKNVFFCLASFSLLCDLRNQSSLETNFRQRKQVVITSVRSLDRDIKIREGAAIYTD